MSVDYYSRVVHWSSLVSYNHLRRDDYVFIRVSDDVHIDSLRTFDIFYWEFIELLCMYSKDLTLYHVFKNPPYITATIGV